CTACCGSNCNGFFCRAGCLLPRAGGGSASPCLGIDNTITVAVQQQFSRQYCQAVGIEGFFRPAEIEVCQFQLGNIDNGFFCGLVADLEVVNVQLELFNGRGNTRVSLHHSVVQFQVEVTLIDNGVDLLVNESVGEGQ